jgi:uncharacterized protein
MWNCPESADELARFFDHFLNDAVNGWETVPRVRSTVLRFTDDPIFGIEEDDFPIPRTDYRKVFLSSKNQLSFTTPPETEIFTYNSEKYLDCASFTHTFNEKTRLVGLPKAVLYVSTLDSKDMDIYVLLRKLDRDGNALLNLNIPWDSVAPHGVSRDRLSEIPERNMNNLMFHVGSLGILRASRRSIDPSRSIHENYPFHPHDKDEYLEPGEVVKMEVGIWAMGVEYEAGESIRVEVHGTSPLLRGEFEQNNPFEGMASKGIHRLHIGGDYPSHVILPFV